MKKPRDLPPRCYLKHGAFFYVSPDSKWHNLGRDKTEALSRYAALTAASGVLDGTMTSLVDVALPLITHGKATSTGQQYRTVAKRIREVFAEFRVEDVRPKHVAQFKLSMRKTPNIANRALTVLRLLFAYAVEQQLCEWNPTIGIKPFPERKRGRLLTPEEVDKIVAVAPPRLAVMVRLLQITGQRVSDVLVIRRSDLQDDGIAFVQRKTGAKVLVRWTPELKEVVQQALALHRNLKAITLFHTRTGGPPAYKTVYDQWRLAATRAKVEDANIHDLRAVAVTAAWRQGLDPQALAGHTSRRMTERYIRERAGVEVTPPSILKVAK